MDYNDHQKELHVLFMKEILLSINFKNYPTYLKGGTALLLCYGLDRFSEDIDLDSEKSFNLARNYDLLFSKDQIDSFLRLSKDIDKMLSFKEDYDEDSILRGRFENDVDELEKQAEKINHLKEKNEIKSILEKVDTEKEKDIRPLPSINPFKKPWER